jgi:hypothetical protein
VSPIADDDTSKPAKKIISSKTSSKPRTSQRDVVKQKVNNAVKKVAEKSYPDRNWLDEVIPDDITIPEQYWKAARILVDPGHDVTPIKDAPPLPNRNFGPPILTLPSAGSFDVTIPAGQTSYIISNPNPSIAFVHVYEDGINGMVARAYAAPHALAKCSTNPGYHMQKNGYLGVRCSAKSLTLTNVSPMVARGGIVRTRRMVTQECITSYYSNTTAVGSLTSGYNVRRWGELPISEGAFMAGSSYNTFDGTSGCYLVSAPIRSTFDVIDSVTKELIRDLGEVQPPETTALCSYQLAPPTQHIGYVADNITVSWVDGTMSFGETISHGVFTASVHDGMTTEMVAITAPATEAQTFSVKFHARYEYICDPTSADYSKTVSVEADAEALDAIIYYASLLPGAYPESYNGKGKVWNAFVKGLRWVGRNVAMPILRGALGGAIGGAKAVASKGFKAAVERSL